MWSTVKELSLSARIAWSPVALEPVMYLAAGTASCNCLETDNVIPELDIYSLNLLQVPGTRLRFLSSITTVARFLFVMALD